MLLLLDGKGDVRSISRVRTQKKLTDTEPGSFSESPRLQPPTTNNALPRLRHGAGLSWDCGFARCLISWASSLGIDLSNFPRLTSGAVKDSAHPHTHQCPRSNSFDVASMAPTEKKPAPTMVTMMAHPPAMASAPHRGTRLLFSWGVVGKAATMRCLSPATGAS